MRGMRCGVVVAFGVSLVGCSGGHENLSRAPASSAPVASPQEHMRSAGAAPAMAPAGTIADGVVTMPFGSDRFAEPVAPGEGYAPIVEQGFIAAAQQPVSTFSIDVDTASYSNVRRFLQQHQRPPRDAVRIEELVNYFKYDYTPPTNDAPFTAHLEVAGCPWQPRHRLAKIGLKGREVSTGQRSPCNLVFLIDVSGSMNHPLKLPLVKQSLRMLVEQLGEADHIALTVYAGAAGMPLPPTPGDRQGEILQSLDRLSAGGSTHGSMGIRLAYEVAKKNFVPGGINRVILCTDGDFNVGVTSHDELESLISTEAKSGVFLTVLGYGMGNLQDGRLERIADRGNGHYAYIDSIAEAKRTLVDQIQGTLVTIAKDVKIQAEFDPKYVAAYRLVGYENRQLANQDFANDAKDAGEIGAGHSVTAFYELIPTDAVAAGSVEFFKLRLRYKAPDVDQSQLVEFAGIDPGRSFEAASNDYRFAAAVAMFGMLLRDSELNGAATWPVVENTATAAMGDDARGERREFLSLVRTARELSGSGTSTSIQTSSR
jgi:Ca-activated chloride channel family protein